MTDHHGVGLVHGRPEVNGVDIHYAVGGSGEPVLLLHGVPKTMYYWRHVVPLLTPFYTIVAVVRSRFGGRPQRRRCVSRTPAGRRRREVAVLLEAALVIVSEPHGAGRP